MFSLIILFTLSIALNVLLVRRAFSSAWMKCLSFIGLGRNRSSQLNLNAQNGQYETNQRNLILTKIKDMHVNELITLRQRFQSVIVDSECRKIPGTKINVPGTGRLLVATYEGEITYGNDLSAITVTEPVGINQVRIIVPHSRILDSYPDLKTLNVILDSAGIFADKTRMAQQSKRLQADVEKVCEHAIQNGILEQADRNTAMVLKSLAEGTGLEAEILFVDAPDTEKAEALGNSSTSAAQLESDKSAALTELRRKAPEFIQGI